MRLFIEPEAEAEREDAARRYEQAVPGLGFEFLAEMRQRTDAVLEARFRYPGFGSAEDVRCPHAVGRVPHLVAYLAHGETVHVLAFMHRAGDRAIGWSRLRER